METGKRNRDRSIDVAIGTNVKRIRTLRGMSQEALGKSLGITFQQVQKYEKGSNSIAACRIPKLCRILNIGLEQLFDGTMRGVRSEAVEPLSSAAIRFARDLDKLPKVRAAMAHVIEAITEEA